MASVTWRRLCIILLITYGDRFLKSEERPHLGSGSVPLCVIITPLCDLQHPPSSSPLPSQRSPPPVYCTSIPTVTHISLLNIPPPSPPPSTTFSTTKTRMLPEPDGRQMILRRLFRPLTPLQFPTNQLLSTQFSINIVLLYIVK